MKATLKKIAALTLTLTLAFGINVGLNAALDSDALDFLFFGSTNTTIEQSEVYASGNSMLPDSPDPRDRNKDKDPEQD